VQLASSRDGRQWNRVGDRRSILERGEEGEFDWGTIRPANSLVSDGDVVRVYYDAHNVSPAAGPDAPGKLVSIGMASWPRDRFVGLKSGPAGGSLRVSRKDVGSELHVNADAAGGSLVAEIVGDDGRPLPGFEAGSCIPLTEDSLDHVVRWRGGPSLAQLDANAAEIGIRLTSAEIFAIW
jgi:hypothetical protein